MPDTAPPTHGQPRAGQAASDRLLEALRGIVGPNGLLTDPADTAPFTEDWRRLYRGRTPAPRPSRSLPPARSRAPTGAR